MKTRLCSVGVAMALSTALHAAGVPIGQVISVKGQATATSESGTRDLALKSPVFVDDQVVTREASSLQLLFTDDSTISQGASSRLAIEEYVYAPGRKTNNVFTANFSDGLFRVVTDKIARENTDGVRVKTRMATMAVRGCDVVFWVTSGDVEVLVLALEGAHEVVVQRTGAGAGQATGGAVSLRDPGTVAIVKAGAQIEQGHMTDAGLASFLAGLTVQDAAAPAANPAGGQPGGSTPGQDAAPAIPQRPPPQVIPASPRAALAAIAPAVAPSLPAQLPVTLPDPPPPTRIFVSRGGGSHWSWGDWETGGIIDSYEFASASVLGAADFAAISGGAQLYSLTGSGIATATILHNGSVAAVEGPCSLSVLVGGGISPVWDGTFIQGNAGGDLLSFDAEGSIGGDGHLTGNRTAYSLKVHGASFGADTLTGGQVSGRLVGPGSGPTPITGTVGSYSFTHGGQATVTGGFGADLH